MEEVEKIREAILCYLVKKLRPAAVKASAIMAKWGGGKSTLSDDEILREGFSELLSDSIAFNQKFFDALIAWSRDIENKTLARNAAIEALRVFETGVAIGEFKISQAGAIRPDAAQAPSKPSFGPS